MLMANTEAPWAGPQQEPEDGAEASGQASSTSPQLRRCRFSQYQLQAVSRIDWGPRWWCEMAKILTELVWEMLR